MRAMKIVWCVVLLLTAAGTASAGGFQKGSSLLAIQATQGEADFVDPTGAGTYLAAYGHSEVGLQVQYWHFFRDDYAMTVSGGLGYFGETNQPGDQAADGATDFKYSQTSWQLRVGGDRVAALNDRMHLFVGPGIQFWSGKSKLEGGPDFPEAVEGVRRSRHRARRGRGTRVDRARSAP